MALYGISFFSGALASGILFQIFLNSLIALLAGYLLWYFSLWSAGDAKLFFVFSFLLPIKYYWRTELPYFPSFVILINTFVPLLIFLFSQSLVFFFQKFLFKVVKESRKFSFLIIKDKIKQKSLQLMASFKDRGVEYLKIISGFLLVFIIFQLANMELRYYFNQLKWGQVGIFFLILLGTNFLRKAFKNKWFLIFIAVGLTIYFILRFLFFKSLLLNFFGLIEGSILFLAIFGLANWLVSSYLKFAKKKQLHFAVWLFLGVILTIILEGSLLRLVF